MNTSDARSHRSTARGRALLALAAVAVLGGVGVIAWTLGRERPRTVFDATDAVAATMPSTVPPLVTEPPAETAARVQQAPPAAPPATADIEGDTEGNPAADGAGNGLSPLARQLGEPGSAIPPTIEPRVKPTRLLIDDIFVADPVRPVGLEPDGELEVPDETEIGWYRYGSSPGRAGATVLAGHVTWNGEYGPFYNLTALEPGDEVSVELEDGSLRRYQVIERTIYGKDALPRERIWRTTGPEVLVLITCGGSFNPDINRYRENVVVYAVPVG